MKIDQNQRKSDEKIARETRHEKRANSNDSGVNLGTKNGPESTKKSIQHDLRILIHLLIDF